MVSKPISVATSAQEVELLIPAADGHDQQRSLPSVLLRAPTAFSR